MIQRLLARILHLMARLRRLMARILHLMGRDHRLSKAGRIKHLSKVGKELMARRPQCLSALGKTRHQKAKVGARSPRAKKISASALMIWNPRFNLRL
jgi:hypothetical protein